MYVERIPIAQRIGINEFNTPMLASFNKKSEFDTSLALLRGSSFLTFSANEQV